LGLHLERHGLNYTEHHTGMVADLRVLPVPTPGPPGLTIRPVSTWDELRLFAGVIAPIFDPPDLAVPLFYDKVADLAIRNTGPIYLYLGYLDDAPVATSVLYLGAGVAGIYDVVTVEWARGQGIGTALTMTALTHAAERGYLVATLQASDQAQYLYARIGFRSCCAFQTYQ
jgi:ribosomal protein S18 acetylase RimI-like enzyme